MIKMYIASPYTLGDTAKNVKKQMDMYHFLMDLGISPFMPLTTHFLHMYQPRDYEEWIHHDLVWIKCCDVLVRLKGESSGADKEVQFALDNEVFVVYSMMDIIEYISSITLFRPRYESIIDKIKVIGYENLSKRFDAISEYNT